MTSIITDDTPLPVKLAQPGAGADLVFVPFQPGKVSSSLSVNGGGFDGADGTRTNYFRAMAASATWANTVVLTVAFNGNIFGLRWNRSYASPFGIRIDGVAYEVPYQQRLNATTQQLASASALGEGVILATDLGDGPHECEIVLPCSVSQTRNFQFYGMIVEARCNPPSPIVGQSFSSAPIALTTSYTALNFTTYSITGISSLAFVNTTGADITVSIRYSSANGDFAKVLVPANGSASWTPPSNRPIDHALELAATATGVNCFPGVLNQ